MSSTRGHEGSLEEALRALSVRCAGPSAPSAVEIEDALERGFGRLISLEARLQRLRRGIADAGSERDSGSHSGADQEALEQEIASLRDALEDLRGRSAPSPGAPLALGFVFPSKR